MSAALILIAFTAVVFAYYRGYLRFWQALPLTLAVVLISMAVDAKADVRVNYSYSPSGCYTWRIQEYRYGVLFHADLWHLNQKVHWCHQPLNKKKFQAGSVWHTHTHWEGAFWGWDGYERLRARHLHRPNRWAFTVWGEFTGNAPAYVNYGEHNYPHILMVVYPDGNTREDVHCGC